VAPAPAVPLSPDPARAAFEAGLRGLNERRFGDAALALERSYTLRPLPVTLYNLALAYRGIGRYLSAIDAFDRYLAAPDASSGPERATAILEEVRDLRAQLVELDLAITPPEATVSIDGRPLAPELRHASLDPGAHVMDVALAGHRPEHRDLPRAPGTHDRIAVALTPLREGRLLVECTSIAARIVIDGTATFTGRAELGLPPGDHHVEVRLDAHLPYARDVRVGNTGTVRLDVALTPLPRTDWRLRGWILGGVAVAAVATGLGLYFALRAEVPDPHVGNWDNVNAPARP
jgi:hypothetical protein